MLMHKQKSVKLHFRLKSLGFALILTASMALATVMQPIVQADRFDQQIAELRAENNQTQGQINVLELQADDLQTTIYKLQQRVNDLEAKITANQAKRAELKEEIAKAEKALRNLYDQWAADVAIGRGDPSRLDSILKQLLLAEKSALSNALRRRTLSERVVQTRLQQIDEKLMRLEDE